MNTLTHAKAANGTKTVRIPVDVWRGLRLEAAETDAGIEQVMARILRRHYGLPNPEQTEPARKTA